MDAKQRAQAQAINEFIAKNQVLSSQFEQIFLLCSQNVRFWEDNEYATVLTDADLEPYRFSLAELKAFIGMQAEILKFATGQPVQSADYQRINNQIK